MHAHAAECVDLAHGRDAIGLDREAGFEGIESRVITVRHTFADFEEFWGITTSGPVARTALDRLSQEVLAALKERIRLRLPPATDGTISYDAWCNAIKGRKPAGPQVGPSQL